MQVESEASFDTDLKAVQKSRRVQRLVGKLTLEKDKWYRCRLTGPSTEKLPDIPIFKNNHRSESFLIVDDARLRLSIEREDLVLNGETFSLVKFRRSDSVLQKGLLTKVDVQTTQVQ